MPTTVLTPLNPIIPTSNSLNLINYDKSPSPNDEFGKYYSKEITTYNKTPSPARSPRASPPTEPYRRNSDNCPSLVAYWQQQHGYPAQHPYAFSYDYPPAEFSAIAPVEYAVDKNCYEDGNFRANGAEIYIKEDRRGLSESDNETNGSEHDHWVACNP